MSAQKGFPLRFLVAVVFLFSGLACNISSSGGISRSTQQSSTGKNAPQLTDFPEFSVFGDLATMLPNPITAAVGPAPSQVALDDGAQLVIPAGAFPTANQIQVVRIDVAFNQVAPDASTGNFYLIRTLEEVPALGKPVLLEIPTSTSDFTVTTYDGTNWVSVQVTPASMIQIPIHHFSWSIWGFFEWWSSRDQQLGQTLDSMDSTDPSSKVDRRIENGDENVRAFFGVNEQAAQTQDDMCLDIQSLLGQYNTTDSRKFPTTSATYDDMVKLLQEGVAPSEGGGPYWKLTENSMKTINDRVLATTGQLSPAAFLKIAIDANNGNIPLGVLAAHNYLKNITYLGREAYFKPRVKGGGYVPPEDGDPASHLASWRQSDNIVPATGEYDKMGPIYHIFAAMTGAVWLPTRYAGVAISGAELYLRTFRRGGDRPDPSKGAADQCGVDAAIWLDSNPPSAEAPLPANPQPVQPGDTATARNYQGQMNDKVIFDTTRNGYICDDAHLYNFRFTLHFYLDDTITMDSCQGNPADSGCQYEFKAQTPNAAEWYYRATDPSSRALGLIFSGDPQQNYATVTYIVNAQASDGTPGACAYNFSLVP